MSDKKVKDRLEYLERLLANAEKGNLIRAAQFIRAAIYGIEFAMEELRPARDGNIVFEEEGHLFLTIGDIKYPVELDESLSPGEWYLRGRASL